ncbi:MAG: hypothetical protein MH208_02785 [Marinobacter sp.]|nr:hypothetical protein [Marinobacter sp.]
MFLIIEGPPVDANESTIPKRNNGIRLELAVHSWFFNAVISDSQRLALV